MSCAPVASRFAEDVLCVYGFSFSLRTNNSDARDAFLGLYQQFRSPSATDVAAEALIESKSDGYLWRLGEKAAAGLDLHKALLGLEAAVCESIIRSQQRLIAIHAATLYSDHSAVMLVGPSGAGKSTLSVALSRRGLTVATDDVALVEPETLCVLPIPRCFHLDDESVQLLAQEGIELPQDSKRLSFMAPIDLDQKSIPRCRAGLLIYIMGPRAESPQLKPVSQAEMTARLLSETGQGPLADAETVRVLSQVSSSASCFALVPGPLGKTADALAGLFLRHEKNSNVARQRAFGIAGLM